MKRWLQIIKILWYFPDLWFLRIHLRVAYFRIYKPHFGIIWGWKVSPLKVQPWKLRCLLCVFSKGNAFGDFNKLFPESATYRPNWFSGRGAVTRLRLMTSPRRSQPDRRALRGTICWSRPSGAALHHRQCSGGRYLPVRCQDQLRRILIHFDANPVLKAQFGVLEIRILVYPGAKQVFFLPWISANLHRNWITYISERLHKEDRNQPWRDMTLVIGTTAQTWPDCSCWSSRYLHDTVRKENVISRTSLSASLWLLVFYEL